MTVLLRVVFFIALSLSATSLQADIEKARDLMESGQFEAAMQAFLPAAKSGNADAEELIGVMYAMGLGCLLYTSPSPRDGLLSRMPSSA